MKLFMRIVGAAAFLAGAGSAWGDAACEKCTHEMQVQYRECLKSGRAQAVCTKEEQDAAQKCITICNTKVPPDANGR
jgi:hypothetical protein